MKWVVLMFVLPIVATAQVDTRVSTDACQPYVEAYLETDNSSASATSFYDHLQKLDAKRSISKSDEAFLRFAFHKTHDKFLRNFKEYASFGDLLNRGSYNCLTATALYALILERFNFDYSITETNYHIFLTAYTSSGPILFEATDALNGFVSDSKEIEKRLATYRQNKFNETQPGESYYHLGCSMYKTVSLQELTGLMHYNEAVDAFNKHQLFSAVDHLEMASAVYCSPRMEELTRIVLLAVIESKIATDDKEQLVKKIQVFRKRNIMALARASK